MIKASGKTQNLKIAAFGSRNLVMPTSRIVRRLNPILKDRFVLNARIVEDIARENPDLKFKVKPFLFSDKKNVAVKVSVAPVDWKNVLKNIVGKGIKVKERVFVFQGVDFKVKNFVSEVRKKEKQHLEYLKSKWNKA